MGDGDLRETSVLVEQETAHQSAKSGTASAATLSSVLLVQRRIEQRAGLGEERGALRGLALGVERVRAR